MRVYAKQAKQSLEVQNHIAEIKLRAERRIGEFSKELPINKGARTDLTSPHDGERSKTSFLSEAGIAHPERFLSKPKDFTYDELKSLLAGFGYEKVKSGKTSGSRAIFVNPETKHIIKLHKPHPRPELKRYQLNYIEETLRNRELIQ